MFNVKVILDSVSDQDYRLTTLVATFPRMILAEVNTHGLISKNSASSRAIPPEKVIRDVLLNPFVPDFNYRVTGMGVGEPLSDGDKCMALECWSQARRAALKEAQRLVNLNVDKSRVNRILEPYMWHTAILSATNWRNFLGLRCPDGDEVDINFPAQPEFQTLAIMIRDALIDSVPQDLGPGEWHVPYASNIDGFTDVERCMISAGVCARVSYNTQDKYESPEESLRRAEKLLLAGHMSPFMHQGQARYYSPTWSGNFYGWTQFRKLLSGENDAMVNRNVSWAGRFPW